MARVALWQISEATLTRLTETLVDLESLLEGWIEEDPSLLQPGLAIVAKQIGLAGSGRLDLLGLDLNGTWTVVEIKRGVVDRDTLAQGLDYASAIAEMAADELRSRCNDYLSKRNTSVEAILKERQIPQVPEPIDRDVAVAIVGTGRATTLKRVASFLIERFEVPITVVSFDVFSTEGGSRILAREITETEESLPRQPRVKTDPSTVLQLADRSGTGVLFRRLFDVATSLQLYPRVWKTSVMFTPPEKRNRMLFTAWAAPVDGKLSVYVGHAPFAEFFPITIDEAKEHLGPEGWRKFDDAELDQFVGGLKGLISKSRLALDGADIAV